MNDAEFKIFMKALPDYLEHVKENPMSLIARIYGVYKVKMEDIVPVPLLLMANTIRCDDSKYLLNVFDLKGSMVNRDVEWTAKLKNTSTLKDKNLQRVKKEFLYKNQPFLEFTKWDRDKIKKIIKKDLEVFKKHKLMDYSLLFAIEKIA